METECSIPSFEKREHTAIITIPGFTKNDIGEDIFSYNLAELCGVIEMDEDIRVVIITSPEEKPLCRKLGKRAFIFHFP
jgi:enoyl-CoA hydratase/carnithine racemase